MPAYKSENHDRNVREMERRNYFLSDERRKELEGLILPVRAKCKVENLDGSISIVQVLPDHGSDYLLIEKDGVEVFDPTLDIDQVNQKLTSIGVTKWVRVPDNPEKFNEMSKEDILFLAYQLDWFYGEWEGGYEFVLPFNPQRLPESNYVIWLIGDKVEVGFFEPTYFYSDDDSIFRKMRTLFA